MKISDIREKSLEELKKLELETRANLANLAFKGSFGQLEKTSELKKLRKDIARILTIEGEKAKKGK